MRTLLVAAIFGVVFAAPAYAAWPDDVSLGALATANGEAASVNASREAYKTVVRELGTSIANKPVAPAHTLGLTGFDVMLTSGLGFVDAMANNDANPAPWERVHPDQDPSHVMWTPGLAVRKGLPLSLEVGANLQYIAFSRQAVLGGYGRWGLVEGYRQYPDVTIQVGYSSYIGNDELELGVMDGSLSIGYDLPFGRKAGFNDASFSPYGGVGVLWINAAPQLSSDEQAALGVGPVSGFGGKPGFQEGFRPATVHFGFQLRSGDVKLMASTSIAPRSITTLNAGFGYVY